MSRDGKNGCYHFARNFHPRRTVGAVACSSRVEKEGKRKMAQPVVSRCLIGVARLSLAVLLVPRPFRCIPPRFETQRPASSLARDTCARITFLVFHVDSIHGRKSLRFSRLFQPSIRRFILRIAEL